MPAFAYRFDAPDRSIVSSGDTAPSQSLVKLAAGAETLVLSHFVPPDDPAVTDAMWLDAARRHFRGTVIVGKDLLEI